MSNWGKGVNNDIGWGQGANNDIGWGSIYDKSNAGETLLSGGGSGYNAFIIEVKTDNAGTSNDNQFQFTGAVGDYDVVAKQNDIVVATFDNLSGEQTITLPSSGVYDLEVSAKEVNGFNRIQFNNDGDKLKLTDIKQWGDVAWSSFEQAFFLCSGLSLTATDSPDLSNVTTMDRMFQLTNIGNIEVSNWDLSNVIDISNMFQGCRNLTLDVSSWNVSNVTDMSYMFYLATSANPDTSNWDVSNVTNMSSMLVNSNLSVENLTLIYENWSLLTLQQNVDFSAGTIKYNASGQAGRDILVNTYNWLITDGGQV
jgi:surface protein